MTEKPKRKPTGKPIAARENPAARAARAKPAQTSIPPRAKIDPAPGAASKPKAGRSADASANRAKAFAEAYLTNGHNATAAAIAAGCPAKSASNAGSRLLGRADVQTMLGARAEKIAERAGLNADRWVDALGSLCFGTVGDLVDAEGLPIPVHKLPRHVQAMIKSITVTKVVTEDGERVETTGYRMWDKVGALGIAARHLGLFERDNAQQSDITVRVELVGKA